VAISGTVLKKEWFGGCGVDNVGLWLGSLLVKQRYERSCASMVDVESIREALA